MNSLKNFFLKNHSDKQTVIKNSIWLFLGQVIGRLIRVIIIIYAARILGAGSYGAFSYALSIAALLSIVADLGLNGTIIRELAKEEKNKLITTAITIKIGLLLVIAIIIPFLAPYITTIEEAIILIPIATLIFLFDSIRDTASAIARAKQKMEYEAWSFIITNLAITALGFIALYLNPSTLYLSIGYALGSLIGAITMVYLIRHSHLKLISFKNFKPLSLLKISLPFAIVAIMGAVLINTDIIMLGWLTSAEETGLYSAAQRPIQLLYIFPSIIAASLFPLTAKTFKENRHKVPQILEKGINTLLLIALPIAIITAIFSKEIISLLYGDTYLLGATSLSILALSIIFVFPSIIIGNTIFAVGQETKLITYSLTGITLNIVLNLFLIPIYGILGCAISTLITQAIINSYIILKVKRIIKINLLKNTSKILIASLISLIFSLALVNTSLHFIISIILTFLFYLIILKLLKEPLINKIPSLLN